jgi:hypothetical protein
VRTKMGGPGAPGEIGAGAETQVWLATSSDPLARQSGRHFYHQRLRETHPAVADSAVQDGLLAACCALTGEVIPDSTGTAHTGPRR